LSRLKLPGLELGLDASNNWRVTNMDGFGQDQIDRLVTNWQDLEATKIKLFDTGATPRQKLEIALQDGNKHEYFVISIEPEIVIAHPQIGLQYHFPADLYYQLIGLRPHETPS
jgi:hypothetical protein